MPGVELVYDRSLHHTLIYVCHIYRIDRNLPLSLGDELSKDLDLLPC